MMQRFLWSGDLRMGTLPAIGALGNLLHVGAAAAVAIRFIIDASSLLLRQRLSEDKRL